MIFCFGTKSSLYNESDYCLSIFEYEYDSATCDCVTRGTVFFVALGVQKLKILYSQLKIFT